MKKLFLILVIISLFLTNSQILSAHADFDFSSDSHGHECCFFKKAANTHTNLMPPDLMQGGFHSHAQSGMHRGMHGMASMMPCRSKNNMYHFLEMQRLKGIIQRK